MPVTTCWAYENPYYSLHAVPYGPARHFREGSSDPGIRTRPRIAAGLARTAKATAVAFRTVAADCAYGDQDGFRQGPRATGLPCPLQPHSAQMPAANFVEEALGRTQRRNTAADQTIPVPWVRARTVPPLRR